MSRTHRLSTAARQLRVAAKRNPDEAMRELAGSFADLIDAAESVVAGAEIAQEAERRSA